MSLPLKYCQEIRGFTFNRFGSHFEDVHQTSIVSVTLWNCNGVYAMFWPVHSHLNVHCFVLSMTPCSEKIVSELWSSDTRSRDCFRRYDGSQAADGQPGKSAHANERWSIPSVTHSATYIYRRINNALHLGLFIVKLLDFYGVSPLCRSSPDLPPYTWQFYFL